MNVELDKTIKHDISVVASQLQQSRIKSAGYKEAYDQEIIREHELVGRMKQLKEMMERNT